MKKGWVYIVLCSDGSYYTGSTSTLEQRIYQHKHAIYSNYTSSRLPVELVFQQEFEEILDAVSAERKKKGWNRAKKKALIDNDFNLLVELSNRKS